jgi:hypothetical protein
MRGTQQTGKTAPPKEIKLVAGTVRVRADGILHVVIADQTDVTTEDAHALHTAAQGLCDVPRPALADIRRARGKNTLAMRHAASAEVSARTTRLAFLVGSPVSRMIGSVFLGLWKTPCPTRMFTDEDAAIAWLLEGSEEAS